ncbi:WXG100 family type VII secretion target [Paenibacillus pabuli]|uniref:WXG100 family type VII secretion target n=1 Tax=Paenibacillus pabuli TaxID=1472 RepID=UPI000780B874|nr:WXG100 family type VII secretion target [Paenibacillus pabuli]MEC0123376.1 WXG100 family type VII secretion target [Paenibacillus pabuli]
MQRIQVHPDVLEEKARLVQQKKQELERMVRELEKSIYFLQSDWSGVTGERFFWDFMQVKEVFPATLGLLDKIQNEFIFIAKNFRTTDGSGEVALYIPEELKRNFGVGLLDKSIGETVTGMGQTAEALFYDPFGTVASVAYAMTVGRVVDVGRGIKFAFDTAWGNGTARSEVEQFVEEQKKQIDQDGLGYYGGSMMGQVLAYAFVGKAFRSVENKHSDLGGSGGGKGKEGNVGSIVRDGNKIKYTNPAGNELTFVDQHPKNINRDVVNFLKSPDVGKATEAKVADFINKEQQITAFGQKILKENGEAAGDLDVVTKSAIIEVKASIKAVKEDQFNKFMDKNHEFFFNPEQKQVILYIDKPLTNLRSEHVLMLERIEKQGVTVVNSLEELKGAIN